MIASRLTSHPSGGNLSHLETNGFLNGTTIAPTIINSSGSIGSMATSPTHSFSTAISHHHHHHHQQQQQQQQQSHSSSLSSSSSSSSAANRRDHNIDYSTLFVQLSGTLPTLYRCVSCNKIVSNRWHHANIHRPQSHECPVCGQKFTRRDNMKAHCKIKHADIKDRFFSHYVHM